MHAFVSVIVGLLLLGVLVIAGLLAAVIFLLLIAAVIDAAARLFGGESNDRHTSGQPLLHPSPH